jgi:hypothetical protein
MSHQCLTPSVDFTENTFGLCPKLGAEMGPQQGAPMSHEDQPPSHSWVIWLLSPLDS